MQDNLKNKKEDGEDKSTDDDSIYKEDSDEYNSDPSYLDSNDEMRSRNESRMSTRHYQQSNTLASRDPNHLPSSSSTIQERQDYQQGGSRQRESQTGSASLERSTADQQLWLNRQQYSQRAQMAPGMDPNRVPPLESQVPYPPSGYAQSQYSQYAPYSQDQIPDQGHYTPSLKRPIAGSQSQQLPAARVYDIRQMQYPYVDKYSYRQQCEWEPYGYPGQTGIDHQGLQTLPQNAMVQGSPDMSERGRYNDLIPNQVGPSHGHIVYRNSRQMSEMPMARGKVMFSSQPTNNNAELLTPENIRKYPSLIRNIKTAPNGLGQVAKPMPGRHTKVSTAIWEKEATVCLVVELAGTCVTRRFDNNMINGTKLLNACGITRGRRDGVLKGEITRYVVKIGGMEFKGVWIPYERALKIAEAEGVLDKLYPLFIQNLEPILTAPQNFNRIRSMLAKSVKRNPKYQRTASRMLVQTFGDSSMDVYHPQGANMQTITHHNQALVPDPGSAALNQSMSRGRLESYAHPEQTYNYNNDAAAAANSASLANSTDGTRYYQPRLQQPDPEASYANQNDSDSEDLEYRE